MVELTVGRSCGLTNILGLEVKVKGGSCVTVWILIGTGLIVPAEGGNYSWDLARKGAAQEGYGYILQFW